MAGAIPIERPSKLSALRNRPLATLMLGHFTVDMYAGLLPVLYPLLIDRFELTLGSVGLVALAYSGVASLSQPFFGWLADRYGTRFTGLALLWTGLTFALIGFAPTFDALLVLAAAAGLGSGAFHPFGALNASAVIAEGQRNIAMSIYVTGGTLGVAIGPLVGALLFSLFDVRGTALMVLPGVGIACWLLVQMRAATWGAQTGISGGRDFSAIGPIPVAAVSVVALVKMLRMWTLVGIQAFVPIWYADLGYSASFYGPLAATLVLASAAGSIGWGSLADRHGRRVVILWSLVLTVPAVLLFTGFPGPLAFVTGALLGFLAGSTGPMLLVMSQQLMRGRAGVASGVVLGLGFVAAAIGVPVLGALADAIGIQRAMTAQVLVVFLTIGVAWFLPTEERVRQLSRAERLVKAPLTPQ